MDKDKAVLAPPEARPQSESEGPTGKSDNATSSQESGQSADKLLGKFKSPEDLAKSYTDLEQALGRQKSEIGSLRQELEAVKTQPEQPAVETPDFQEARAAIEAQIDEGELSVAEGMMQLTELTKQETAAEMEAKFADYDEKRTAKEQYASFIDANPDFLEMEDSGVLDQVIQSDPMHDKFSAYWLVKGQQQAEIAAQTAREEALKLAKGADGTRVILDGNGQGAREFVEPRQDMSRAERLNGMMAALAKARASGG